MERAAGPGCTCGGRRNSTRETCAVLRPKRSPRHGGPPHWRLVELRPVHTPGGFSCSSLEVFERLRERPAVGSQSSPRRSNVLPQHKLPVLAMAPSEEGLVREEGI